MATIDQDVQVGWTIYGGDGHKIGTIEQVGPGYARVRKGLLFPKDVFVPFTEIDEIDPTDNTAYVTITKDEIDGQGWDRPPVYRGAQPAASDALLARSSTRPGSEPMPWDHPADTGGMLQSRAGRGLMGAGVSGIEAARDWDRPFECATDDIEDEDDSFDNRDV